jgi:hypothetical protein
VFSFALFLQATAIRRRGIRRWRSYVTAASEHISPHSLQLFGHGDLK